mmetsp:Transcript_2367/g.7116  ORF Transcript_2367/g.7116 Transcript_2367/m.7116 type:complete len:211 (+) Transcript_2367:1094-1726(+)
MIPTCRIFPTSSSGACSRSCLGPRTITPGFGRGSGPARPPRVLVPIPRSSPPPPTKKKRLAEERFLNKSALAAVQGPELCAAPQAVVVRLMLQVSVARHPRRRRQELWHPIPSRRTTPLARRRRTPSRTATSPAGQIRRTTTRTTSTVYTKATATGTWSTAPRPATPSSPSGPMVVPRRRNAVRRRDVGRRRADVLVLRPEGADTHLDLL